MMARYRKKPVEIEARRLNMLDYDEVLSIAEWCGGRPVSPDIDGTPSDVVLAIDTLEGTMYASGGDWIIRGVAGEHYPCKPDIFAATYDLVVDA